MPTLSSDAARAIVAHMNDDHADAIVAYARAYAGVVDVTAARMTALDAHAMELAVETATGERRARVAFDHELQDTTDARMTLVAMAQQAGTPEG